MTWPQDDFPKKNPSGGTWNTEWDPVISSVHYDSCCGDILPRREGREVGGRAEVGGVGRERGRGK